VGRRTVHLFPSRNKYQRLDEAGVDIHWDPVAISLRLPIEPVVVFVSASSILRLIQTRVRETSLGIHAEEVWPKSLYCLATVTRNLCILSAEVLPSSRAAVLIYTRHRSKWRVSLCSQPLYPGKGKVKQSHYTPWRRLKGETYSSYSFTTSALDGSEWSASLPGRALPPGKGTLVPIVQEAGWALEPVWTQRLEEKSLAPAGDRTQIARSSSP
jgi:hypothetical protein